MGRAKIKLAPESSRGDTEITKSPRGLFSPEKAKRAALQSYVVSPKGDMRQMRCAFSGRVVATLSKRQGQWSYKILPGLPGADGKIHMTHKSLRDAKALVASKIGGYKV
jgi:hypothetical protein